MIPAYNEFYVPHLSRCLGTAFDISCNHLGMDIDDFAELFCGSKIALGIETGDPHYLAGISGREISEIITGKDPDISDISRPPGDAYWTGYILARIQWKYNVGFCKIQKNYPCGLLRSRYEVYHEMDDSRILEAVGKYLTKDNVIKERRKLLGMTQRDLSQASGISLGTIRAYEQGVLYLENAPVKNLLLLGRTLGLSADEIISDCGNRAPATIKGKRTSE